MSADASPMLQSVALGTAFVSIAAVTDTIYAVCAGAIAPVLSRMGDASVYGRLITGAALIGLGFATAWNREA